MKRNHPAHGPKTLCNACGVRLSRRVKAADKAKPLPRSSGTEQPKPAAADKQALAYDKPVRARLPTKQALQSQGYPGVLHDRADRGALGKLHVGSGDKPPLSLEQQQAASRVGDAPRSGSKRRIPCDDASPTKHSRTGCAPLLSLCCRAAAAPGQACIVCCLSHCLFVYLCARAAASGHVRALRVLPLARNTASVGHGTSCRLRTGQACLVSLGARAWYPLHVSSAPRLVTDSGAKAP